jgi:hypothetical protein
MKQQYDFSKTDNLEGFIFIEVPLKTGSDVIRTIGVLVGCDSKTAVSRRFGDGPTVPGDA